MIRSRLTPLRIAVGAVEAAVALAEPQSHIGLEPVHLFGTRQKKCVRSRQFAELSKIWQSSPIFETSSYAMPGRTDRDQLKNYTICLRHVESQSGLVKSTLASACP